ncbi:putative leucine-rich repeat-containing protein DDB_G0290503 [Danaus plexippus]|uniref:putative leucine-rich repeat-containing protein DDB_G0290503 n=1 Tax=Danaus plexippus TaxID=13037 RepID=UPI002AB2C053|nr:putative leucine-rich repeat-containing protein DDB_G0290503 [Danaus plexippus]
MMWFLLVACVLQIHGISSQHLKSDDCCPCSPENSFSSSNVLNKDHVSGNCPCRDADSEPASSIFRPSFKTATNARQVDGKEEPKPLLNPEVGLASSVLETLREVSDQEYQDALARDVARSALRSMNTNAEADETGDESKNVVKIILGPRHNTDMDTISEPSHNHETRCIHPSPGQENVFEQYQEQPQRKLYKHFILSKPVVGLQKNIFDMDNSPSDIQESVVTVRPSVLDNIKMKTDLLKSKLFLNNEGLTQRNEPKISFDKVIYKPVIKLPDFNLASPLEHFKKSKLFDSYKTPSPAVMTKDNSLYKSVNINGNSDLISPQQQSQSRKLDGNEKLLPQFNSLASKEARKSIKSADSFISDDFNTDNTILKPVLALRDDCDPSRTWLQIQTTTEKSECVEVNSLPSSVSEEKSTDILSTVPSPSELIGDENNAMKDGDNELSENCEPNLNSNPNPERNVVDEDNETDLRASADQTTDDMTNELLINGDRDERKEEDSGNECIVSENTKNKENSIGVEVLNDSMEENKENKDMMDDSESAANTDRKMNAISSIPELKEGIRNNLNELRKANEKWQEKMKLNVHDTLNRINKKNNIAKSPNTQSESLKDNDSQNASEILQEFDGDSEAHASNNCKTPAEDFDEFKDHPVTDSIKEKYNTEYVGSEPQNLNEHIPKNVDETNECKIHEEKTSNLDTKLDSVNNEDSEMEVQASESKQRNAKIDLDNLRYVKQDINDEANNLNNVGSSFLQANNFFDDVKSKLTNVFGKTNENIFSGFVSNAGNVDRTDSRGFIKDRVIDFTKPLLNLDKSTDLFKNAPDDTETKRHSIKSFNSNLQPFKARVAIPESLDIKPSLTRAGNTKEMSQKLYNSQKILPKTYASRIYSQNSDEKSGDERLFYKESDIGSLNSESTILSPKTFKNTLQFPTSKNLLSSNLKGRPDGALKNIHDTLGSSLRSMPFNHDDLLETMASKRNELNERLKSLNYDLNDRLSSLLPSFRVQPLTQNRITSKNRSDVRNKQALDNLRNLPFTNNVSSRSKLNTLSRKSNADSVAFKPLKKSVNVRDRLADLKILRLRDEQSLKRPTSAKSVFTSPVESKSSRTASRTMKPALRTDSKIISLTPPTSPKTSLPRLKTVKSSEKQPFALYNMEKRPIISKLKSSEPFTLASENTMSRAPFHRTAVADKSALDTSSSDLDARSLHKTSKQDVGKNIAISKLKEVLKARSFNNDLQKPKVIDDVIPAATEVEDPKTGILRQNVQYKCKMVCTKDN